MKKQWILLILLTLGLILGSAYAGNRRIRRPSTQPPTGCVDEIGLTQEQKRVMETIRQETVEALRQAETPKAAREIIEEMRRTMQALLTNEQMEALRECLRPEKPATCMDQIDLTPEQIEAIDAIRQAAMEALKEAETPQEARDIIEQMHQAVEGVLTEEQLAALRECRRPDRPVNCMDQIDLTPEQIVEIDAIRQAAMAELETAETREEIRAIINQMSEDIMAVLTVDQLAALEECRDGQRHRWRYQEPEPDPDPEPDTEG